MSDRQSSAGPDRRGFILGMTGALVAASSQAADKPAGQAGTSRQLDFSNPDDLFTAMLRMQARTDGKDAPWWYFGKIYGIVGEGAPKLLVRFEGCEIMRLTPAGSGELAATGVTTSFFQDPQTKAVLRSFSNPYTGKTNQITPNQIGGTANPVAYYSAGGVRPARVAPADWKDSGLHLTWDYHGDTVWMSHDRVYPPGIPQPMGESSVARARLADLHDLGRPFIPAGFSSTYFAPWPRWMEMDGKPGHVIWHADGIKLESIEQFPRSFRAEMEAQFPQRLHALPYVAPAA